MKLPTRHSTVKGNVLLVTLVTTAIVGFVLASFLALVKAQNYSTMRSQAWNASMPVIEAGIEEALTHLNKSGTTNLSADGWLSVNGVYAMTRQIGDSYYVVTISADSNPVIVSRGYVPLPVLVAQRSGPFLAQVAGGLQNNLYVDRGVRVTTRRDSMFSKALVAKSTIDLNGNNITTDSFDSTDPLYSTLGRYDSSKRKANGDVATNSSLTNSLSIGNADIYGRVATGPRGSVSIGPNGSVGDLAWHASGHTGIETGFYNDDMNVSFPDVNPPFTGGAFTPGGGTVDGDYYNYVLGDGNYQLSSLKISGQKDMIVTGHAVLYVTGDVDISGQAYVHIAPDASLEMYVGGPIQV